MIAHTVAERTHEIGIRLVLGAERGRVVCMTVKQGMISVIVGMAAGVVGAPAASRLMAGLLYGVKATDARTFTMVALALLAIGFVACAARASSSVR